MATARIKLSPEEARKLLATLPGSPALYDKLAQQFIALNAQRRAK